MEKFLIIILVFIVLLSLFAIFVLKDKENELDNMIKVYKRELEQLKKIYKEYITGDFKQIALDKNILSISFTNIYCDVSKLAFVSDK